jgi:hypothetical protein
MAAMQGRARHGTIAEALHDSVPGASTESLTQGKLIID